MSTVKNMYNSVVYSEKYCTIFWTIDYKINDTMVLTFLGIV